MTTESINVSGVETASGELRLCAYPNANTEHELVNGIEEQKYGAPAISFTKPHLIEFYLLLKTDEVADMITDIKFIRERLSKSDMITDDENYTESELRTVYALIDMENEKIIELIHKRLDELGKLRKVDFDIEQSPWLEEESEEETDV